VCINGVVTLNKRTGVDTTTQIRQEIIVGKDMPIKQQLIRSAK
jgi:hypothetical protein